MKETPSTATDIADKTRSRNSDQDDKGRQSLPANATKKTIPKKTSKITQKIKEKITEKIKTKKLDNLERLYLDQKALQQNALTILDTIQIGINATLDSFAYSHFGAAANDFKELTKSEKDLQIYKHEQYETITGRKFPTPSYTQLRAGLNAISPGNWGAGFRMAIMPNAEIRIYDIHHGEFKENGRSEIPKTALITKPHDYSEEITPEIIIKDIKFELLEHIKQKKIAEKEKKKNKEIQKRQSLANSARD